MNVCLVSHNVVRGDGQGRVNYEVAMALLRQGHTVSVVADRLDEELKGEVTWLCARKGTLPINLLQGQIFAAQSTRLLANYVGLVHANGFVSWVAADVNTAHFVHSAWLRSPHHTLHHRHDAYGAYQWAYTRLNAAWEKRAFAQARVVVAVSAKVRGELVDFAHVDAAKVRVIPNGVDPDEFWPHSVNRGRFGLPLDKYMMLYVGDLRTPRKNLDAVLKAMKLLPHVHLAVVGETTGSRYPELAAQVGVRSRVHFLGYRPDVADVMAAADVLVFPSHYEPDGLVVREAMATGMPVITAATVGGSERVLDGYTGFVLGNENNAELLADRVRWLHEHPGDARTMGVRARDSALEQNWARMAAEYISLYEEIGERLPPVSTSVRGRASAQPPPHTRLGNE